MRNQQEIFLLGAGGHAQSCVDVIEAEGRFRIAGIVQDKLDNTQQLFGYPTLGTDDQIEKISESVQNACIGIGQLDSPDNRIRVFEKLQSLGVKLPTLISPYAYVSKRASIGIGVIVMPGAVINAGVTIGNNCIINSQALIEHGSRIGNHCHISTGVRINGECEVGQKSFIGSGSLIRQGIQVPPDSFIHMGSVLNGKSSREP